MTAGQFHREHLSKADKFGNMRLASHRNSAFACSMTREKMHERLELHLCGTRNKELESLKLTKGDL